MTPKEEELWSALANLLKCYCDGQEPTKCCTCCKNDDGTPIAHPANPCEVCVAVKALESAGTPTGQGLWFVLAEPEDVIKMHRIMFDVFGE